MQLPYFANGNTRRLYVFLHATGWDGGSEMGAGNAIAFWPETVSSTYSKFEQMARVISMCGLYERKYST